MKFSILFFSFRGVSNFAKMAFYVLQRMYLYLLHSSVERVLLLLRFSIF